MSRVVTADEVRQHFVRSESARLRFDWWRRAESRASVVTTVMAHESRVVVSATLDDIERVCDATEHALGQIRKSDVDVVDYVRDWTCPFAGTHVFHFITEYDGAVPTWQHFRTQCASERFRHMLWEPAQRAIKDCVARTGVSSKLAHDAMQWRIGNMYYSFLREQWAHAYLRNRGVDVLQHPLADALFGVDGWVGDRVVSFFIGNRSFRSASGGRKNPAASYLNASRPPFTFTDLELPVADKFGVVLLPSKEGLDECVRNGL